MSDNVCFIDCETTGLDADAHQIWEVGLITPDGREHLWQFPVDEMKADPFALDIGRWWDRRWKKVGADSLEGTYAIYDAHKPEKRGACVPARELEAWAKHFRDLVGTNHLCGAVVSFDEERLRRLLHRLGVRPRWHYHLIDVEALAAGWVIGKYSRIEPAEDQAVTLPWNSNELSRAVGVDPDQFDRHTALGDARWAKALYEAVMGQ